MKCKNFLDVLLSFLIVFSLFSCDSSSYYIKGTSSILHPDKKFRVLQRQVSHLESDLGVRYYEFEYCIPSDKKFIVTMKAELNGELLPKLSGHFHLPPAADAKKRNEGLIAIRFCDPPFQSKAPISTSWTYHFSCPVESSSYSASSPFKLLPALMSNWSFSSNTQKDLAADHEYQVLKLIVRGENKSGSDGESNQWNYSLIMSVRVASFDDSDSRDRVTRVEL